jgi:hypothetical protein
MVVENKAGAAGMIGLKALASAKPDGYTVGQIPISVTRFSQLGTVAIDPLLASPPRARLWAWATTSSCPGTWAWSAEDCCRHINKACNSGKPLMA